MSQDGNGDLRFDRVEGAAPAAACASCQRSLPDIYFESNGKLFCAPCKDAALASHTGGSRVARLLKALLFGAVAAAISAAIWYAIIALTGYELGIVAIAVGIAVGVAVRVGSEGRGGWAYQAIAIVLTYVAIASSYVPIVLEQTREEATRAFAEREAAGDPIAPEVQEFARYSGAVVVSLMLPVFQVMDGGVIGLLIVGFALYEAWRINKRQTVAFNGPFRVEARRPASVA